LYSPWTGCRGNRGAARRAQPVPLVIELQQDLCHRGAGELGVGDGRRPARSPASARIGRWNTMIWLVSRLLVCSQGQRQRRGHLSFGSPMAGLARSGGGEQRGCSGRDNGLATGALQLFQQAERRRRDTTAAWPRASRLT
jgi:hypothetical protein